nr:unnamed protein product [Digitaria exilis]
MAMAVMIRLAGPVAFFPPAPCSSSLRRPGARGRAVRLRVACRAGGGDGAEGKEEEEAPESLFARELRRRGMAPGAAPAEAKEAEEGGAEAGRKRGVAAAEFERGAAADGQRERSMALNSEGLEYFGPSFVHDASKNPVSPPPYIDPYELLEDERLTRPSPDVF